HHESRPRTGAGPRGHRSRPRAEGPRGPGPVRTRAERRALGAVRPWGLAVRSGTLTGQRPYLVPPGRPAMSAPPSPSMPRALPAGHRARLMRTAREVSFPQGSRLFEEGGWADRFWVIRTGTVELDMRVPGRRAAVIERL